MSPEPVGSGLSRLHRESANQADFAESAFRVSTTLSYLVLTWVFLALPTAAVALGNVMVVCARRILSPSSANKVLIQIGNIYPEFLRRKKKTLFLSRRYGCIITALMLYYYSINVEADIMRLEW